jgi:leader peptidase (prepilin peptidase)/N-methyltransferase
VPTEYFGIPVAAFYPLAFVFGALWGSFLNVCIVRFPAGRSVVRPSSRCQHCETPIRPYDNIPIVSYLWLRGRCRACKARFSPRYLVVEVLTGALSLALFQRFGFSPSFAAYFAFCAALLVATFVDLAHFIIPNQVTYFLLPVGLAVSFIPGATVRPLDAAIGAAAGFGFFALIAFAFHALRGVRGLGFGDVKLMGGIGAFLGWRALPLLLFLSAAQGLLAAVAVLLARRGRPTPAAAPPPPPPEGAKSGEDDEEDDGPPPGRLAMPFGPFLALGSLEVLFFGPAISRAIFGISL